MYAAAHNLTTAYTYKQESWVCRYGKVGYVPEAVINNDFKLYVAALYVAMLQLGGGVGSIVSENTAEYVFYFVCLLLGSVLWAIVVSGQCNL